jgi:hypothetical protein
MVSGIPPEILRRRNGSLRATAWMLLVIIVAVFFGLYFFGVLPGGSISHLPA